MQHEKIVVSKHRQSREHMSNPNSNESLVIRKNKSGSVKYGKNKSVEDFGNGYSRIVTNKGKKP